MLVKLLNQEKLFIMKQAALLWTLSYRFDIIPRHYTIAILLVQLYAYLMIF